MVSSHLNWTAGAYKSPLSFGAEDASLLMQILDWSSVVCMTHWILEPPHHYHQFRLVSTDLPVTSSCIISHVSFTRRWHESRTLNSHACYKRTMRCLKTQKPSNSNIRGVHAIQWELQNSSLENAGAESTARKKGNSCPPAYEWRLSCQCHFPQASQWFGSL